MNTGTFGGLSYPNHDNKYFLLTCQGPSLWTCELIQGLLCAVFFPATQLWGWRCGIPLSSQTAMILRKIPPRGVLEVLRRSEERLRRERTFSFSFSRVCPPVRALPSSPHLAERRTYVSASCQGRRSSPCPPLSPAPVHLPPGLPLFGFRLAYLDTADSAAGAWRGN